ncbi:hypothetical protein [Actinoplanes sp. NPDC049118]|uniref:hypothetical protein n=1 Tax=Actinoplanes sp. NPDC049118 TaxID=3155769 RepID=UPI0033C6408D
MAEESPLSATGNLTEAQYEAMAHPQAPDGLIGHPSDAPPVSVSGGQIIIRASLTGLLRGFPWASGLTPIVYTPSLSGPARVDLVVLRLFRDDGYRVGTAVRTGTAATAPAPFVGTGPTDWYEIPLAEVRVAGGVLTLLTTRAWYLGDDGQILCKSTSRPPHAPGRQIRETDTGRSYQSSGTVWTVMQDDGGTSSLPLAGGWVNAVNHLYRVNGIAFLQLSARRTGGNIAVSTPQATVGTLPAGFRPRADIETIGISSSSGAHIVVRIKAAGPVTLDFVVTGLNTGQYIQLAAAAWPVA